MNIGNKVQALDDDFQGIVVDVQGDLIAVEDENGFIIHFHVSELVLDISSQDAIRMGQVTQSQITEKEKFKNKVRKVNNNSKKDKSPPMEVDLHIEKLLPNKRGMSNYEILNLQLETAKKQLEFAKNKRIQRIVFIHGVGEGVLKEELYYLLRRYEGLDFYDANYQKYGVGATEVYLYQKSL